MTWPFLRIVETRLTRAARFSTRCRDSAMPGWVPRSDGLIRRAGWHLDSCTTGLLSPFVVVDHAGSES